MAPINSLSVLAFASTVIAVPHAQWQPFKRHAHPGAPPAYGDGSSSAAPASSAPPSYGSSAPPAYGSSSSEAPVSSILAYGSSSSAGPASSSYSIPAYGSSSSAAPVSSSYGIPSYGWSSSAAPISSSYSIPAYGSSSSAGPASSSYSGYPSGYSASYASSGYASTSICTETDTLIWRSTTEFSTYYVTHTVYASAPTSEPIPASYGPSSAAPGSEGAAPSTPGSWGSEGAAPSAPGSYENAGSCVPDVTVTTTERTTIYVTPGASSGAPAPSSYAIPNKEPSYGGGGGWGAPSESAPAPSSYAAPSSGAPAPSSYSAPSSIPSGGPSGGYSGKRGLAYNDASLCNSFTGTNAVGWAYNWGSDSSGLDSSIPFIPMLWGPAPEFSSSWAAKAKAAIAGGAQYLFSFNEPDMSNQANLSPEAAAEAWRTYMEPFAGQAKLVAPSVTNGQDSNMGLGWLQQFLDACSGCTIDAVAQHWYFPTNDAQNFKDQISKASSLAGGKPVWINEFGATGSDEDKSKFLEDVLPWMDSNESVAGYSYYMVADGLLNSGSGLSSYGETYANA